MINREKHRTVQDYAEISRTLIAVIWQALISTSCCDNLDKSIREWNSASLMTGICSRLVDLFGLVFAFDVRLSVSLSPSLWFVWICSKSLADDIFRCFLMKWVDASLLSFEICNWHLTSIPVFKCLIIL